LNREDWKFGGIRPANFPYRRIAALGHLIVRHQKNGGPSAMFADLIAEIQRAMSQPGNQGYSKKNREQTLRFFLYRRTGLLGRPLLPSGKKLSAPQALIGPARSSEITVNIVVPIGLIYARASKSVAMEATLNWLLKSGKRTSDNRLMRFMKHYNIWQQRKDAEGPGQRQADPGVDAGVPGFLHAERKQLSELPVPGCGQPQFCLTRPAEGDAKPRISPKSPAVN
jgi:hypothetical protein